MIPNELLWQLKPDDIARLIVLEPSEPVARHKFWHKRDMRISPSRKNTPRVDDLKRLNKAAQVVYWDAFHEDWHDEFRTLFGLAPTGPVLNPLQFDQQGWKHGLYRKADFDEDVAYYNAARSYLWLQFLRGQLGQGPVVSGLVYLKLDSLLEAEILRCKNKLAVTLQLIANKKAAKRRGLTPRQEIWHNIGNDEPVAMKFKQQGYTIRKIDTLTDRHWEVQMT